jgi:hypothetical protein
MNLRVFGRPAAIGLFAGLTWILALGVAGTASAQNFSDLAGADSVNRGPGSALTAFVTVSANYDVTGISTVSEIASPHNMRFFIYNINSATVLYSSAPKAFLADGGPTTKASDPFAAVTLTPGNTYLIGAVADAAGLYFYSTGPIFTSGVVTNSNSAGNVNNFAANDFFCCFSARTNLALTSTPPAPVPTMSEWMMILFGLGLVGTAVLVVQQRRLAL